MKQVRLVIGEGVRETAGRVPVLDIIDLCWNSKQGTTWQLSRRLVWKFEYEIGRFTLSAVWHEAD